ncbi:hypothetical protein [Streptomyces sp. NBC_00078]|uniref:hypothetical protein n=1 Tax=unclassified Streptomyces TaxID=2593676 RepID=UPI0022569F17|nr:hypothetical protein [Streptomyces sp. NBC_00078]MCX5423669.1 hypothetical protein [Streptomyces sp. NBC_00078]
MDAGDLATWVGSSFAAIAAGATIWTLKSQRDQIDEQRQFIAEQSATLALERAELWAAAQDRKIAQARQVGMTVQLWARSGVPGDANGEPIPDTFRIEVRNLSIEPIHEVTVRFGEQEAHEASAAVETDLIRRGLTVVTDGPRLNVPVPLVGAGRIYLFTSGPLFEEVDRHRPALLFTDNAGVRWRLNEHGDLREFVPAG